MNNKMLKDLIERFSMDQKSLSNDELEIMTSVLAYAFLQEKVDYGEHYASNVFQVQNFCDLQADIMKIMPLLSKAFWGYLFSDRFFKTFFEVTEREFSNLEAAYDSPLREIPTNGHDAKLQEDIRYRISQQARKMKEFLNSRQEPEVQDFIKTRLEPFLVSVDTFCRRKFH